MSGMLPVKIIPPTTSSREIQPSSEGQASLGNNTHLCCGLFVGVSEFGEGLETLPGAPRDAYSLYLELSHTGRYKQTEMLPVTNPTRLQLRLAIQQWTAKVQGQSPCTALLYLSTHGCYVNGTYHLCVADSSFRNGSYRHTVSWPELRTWLASLQAHPVIVILDSCRHHSQANQSETASSHPSELPEKREDIALYGEHWAVWTAAAVGQLAQEASTHSDGANGLFSWVLLRTLQEIPDFVSEICLRELYETVKDNLQREVQSRQLPLEQEPRLYVGQMDMGEICFVHRTPTPLTRISPRVRMFAALALLVSLFAWGGVTLWEPGISQITSSGETCHRCVTRQWSELRQQDCATHTIMPPLTRTALSNCSLPCNLANFQQVGQRCLRACEHKPQQLQSAYRKAIQKLAAITPVSVSQCQQLLSGLFPRKER